MLREEGEPAMVLRLVTHLDSRNSLFAVHLPSSAAA
jgi:hypothetical protein